MVGRVLLLETGMSKKPINRNSNAIVKLITEGGDDPEGFDTLMEEWNALLEIQTGEVERSFADVEAAALSTISAMPDDARQSSVGRKVADMLETFESPAYLVRENGEILTQNKAAFQTFDLGVDATLDDLPLDLEANIPIATVIRDCFAPNRNSTESVLKRAFSSLDDSSLTLSITPSKPIQSGRGEALVFVVDGRWKMAAAGLIKHEFDLTNSERELLEAFLDGQTTQDMATNRGRSHATIRTQFHSLMTKMGARSQTELFRNALSVSQFVDKVEDIAEVIRHPYRKRVDLMRPGGRSVEVTLSGDFSGRPFVFIQSLANYTFERKIEQVFHEAGICVLSICRPGAGDTDPPVDGSTVHETMGGDIEAVLSQLGQSQCVLMTTNMTSAFMYRTARRMSGYLMGMIQIAAPVPVAYSHNEDDAVPWSKGMTRAMQAYPAMADFIVKAGVTAWMKMGMKAFIQVQFRKHKELLERTLQPEPLAEHNRNFDVSKAQGAAILAYDVKSSYEDFRDDIRATDVPILAVHGSHDPHFAIKAVRRFAADFGERVSLMEIPDAGFGPFDTHAKQISEAMIIFAEMCDRRW